METANRKRAERERRERLYDEAWGWLLFGFGVTTLILLVAIIIGFAVWAAIMI